MSSYTDKIKSAARLVTLPDIYFKLKSLLDDPDYTMAEVALLVGRDPALSARFLKIVNSPLVRRHVQIETVSHAISMLGAKQVHDIVLGASVASSFQGLKPEIMDMRQFWHQSVRCGVTARQLSLRCAEVETERMFLTGLLHDMGHMFMYLAIPSQAEQAIIAAKDQNRPLYQVERELFGFDYASIAEVVMKDWHLPDSLLLPIKHHPEPDAGEPFMMETALLHIAQNLAQTDIDSSDFDLDACPIDPDAWQWTGLGEPACLDALKAAAANFADVRDSFFS